MLYQGLTVQNTTIQCCMPWQRYVPGLLIADMGWIDTTSVRGQRHLPCIILGLSLHEWRHRHQQTSNAATFLRRTASLQLGLSPGARYHLQRIVSTRETDAAAKQAPASIAELEKYAEGTASQLLTLQVTSSHIVPTPDAATRLCIAI